MHGIRSLFAWFVAIAPERCSAVHAVLVEGVEIYVKRPEFFLVVLVVAGDAAQRFEAGVRGRFALAHHFDDGMAAGNLDVFLALARRTRGAHFIVHEAARANDR